MSAIAVMSGVLSCSALAWLLAVGALLALALLAMDITKPRGYPPGPAWLPVVGSYPAVRRLLRKHGYMHDMWTALAARYGAVLGLRLGHNRVVVVSGFAAVREVLTRDEFDGRPDGFFFRMRCFGERLGIVFTEGPHWQEQRKFSLKNLKNLGLGRRTMEARISEEAAELVAALRARGAGYRPVLLHDAFNVCALNSLWAIFAGKRFKLDDARLGALLRQMNDCFRQGDMLGGLLNQMPFLRFVAPEKTGYTLFLNSLNSLWAFLRETIDEHVKTLPHDHPRDLIDAFLMEMQSQAGKANSTFTEKQLVSLCVDMFMAGTETTANTLGFSVMFLIRHPKVQARAQAELDRVVGRDRQPTLQDRPLLGYFEAVVNETLRLANTAPVGIAHRTMSSTTLLGHVIPKDTTVLTSIWSVHMDPEHWGDPENFRPERFLDSAGKVVQDDHFLPFGIGKRRCPGETLARSTLFVFLAALLHNFHLTPAPGHPIGPNHYLDGVTLSPKPFLALLTPRDG